MTTKQTPEPVTAEPVELVPTPATEWVDPQPAKQVTLPSGNSAIIKKPNFYVLARTGQVPPRAKKATAHSQAAAKKTDPTPEQIMDRLDDIELYVDWALVKAFIEPRVTFTQEAGAVPVSALTAEDKAFVVETLGIEV